MQNLIFYQLFESESSTYTYLLADPVSRKALVVDPVRETVERDAKLLGELELALEYVLETHVHADHVTGASELKRRTGARIALAKSAGATGADVELEDGATLELGPHRVRVLATPGHTETCLSYHVGDRLFSGDALLIRGCGRTDFQQGSAAKLYRSVTGRIFTLPDETLVFPAHDYKGLSHTTVGLEKKHNPRLGGGKSEAEFIAIMAALKLAPPKKIDIAVPANLKCGKLETP